MQELLYGIPLYNGFSPSTIPPRLSPISNTSTAYFVQQICRCTPLQRHRYPASHTAADTCLSLVVEQSISPRTARSVSIPTSSRPTPLGALPKTALTLLQLSYKTPNPDVTSGKLPNPVMRILHELLSCYQSLGNHSEGNYRMRTRKYDQEIVRIIRKRMKSRKRAPYLLNRLRLSDDKDAMRR